MALQAKHRSKGRHKQRMRLQSRAKRDSRASPQQTRLRTVINTPSTQTSASKYEHKLQATQVTDKHETEVINAQASPTQRQTWLKLRTRHRHMTTKVAAKFPQASPCSASARRQSNYPRQRKSTH
eukprot:1795144-Amphidinium_carterae.2